jgi:hypothetical protein
MSIPRDPVRRIARKNLKRSGLMRVMVIVKATRDTEGGAPPRAELVSEMGKFNEAPEADGEARLAAKR